MPELTQRVARFVRNGFKRPSITNGVEGWLTEGEAQVLLRLARIVPADQAIVEIGSYRGRSTVVLARGSMEGAGPRVYAIDPHDSVQGVNGAHFGPQDQEALYRNILEHGAAAIVAVVCLPSLAAATGWPDKPVGLLWLDGDHRYEALSADVTEWTKRLAPGATVAFHDANLQAVEQVINEFREKVTVLEEGRQDNLVWLKLGAAIAPVSQ